MKKLTLLAASIGALAALPTVSMAEDAFFEALSSGKVSFSSRVRYETVDQDNALKDADALTLRTTLGYKTGSFNGFGGFLELENIIDLSGDYNDTNNGDTKYSVIADPDGTDMNQAYLWYNGFDTEFKLGRQEITYRKTPFHRYIGNVLWRQDHQSFDAFSLQNHSFENTSISYAYITKVDTILGDKDAKPFLDNGKIDMNSHLVNLKYSGLPFGNLEAYGYFLDYDDKPAISSKTIGVRLNGAQSINDDWKLIYTAEYADQSDFKDGTMDSQNYYLAELGGKYKGWLAKFSYEMQEGDGTDSFKTPLGTNHAFQGWADMFLSTPKEGLRDMYFTVVGKVFGAKLVAVYHDFETDKSSLDAGSEFDILLQKTFKEHYTVGIKYADYNADSEYTAVNAKSVDTEKFWLYGQLKF
jgi:hypothetical protein